MQDSSAHTAAGPASAQDNSGPRPVALILSEERDALVPSLSLSRMGLKVVNETTPEAAAQACSTHRPDLVVMPLRMGDVSTLSYLQHCLEQNWSPMILVIAAYDQINEAAEAMRAGASDCLFKPFSDMRLERTIRSILGPKANALGHIDGPETEGTESEAPDMPRASTRTFHGMIGQSPAMQSLFDRVDAVAKSSAPVMIRGEIGTGKTMLAHAIHSASHRPQGPMIVVNCANVGPEDGAEFLFGQAGTGALARATGGTLFLDRIEDLPLRLQARLLSDIQRANLGGEDSADVRFLASLSLRPSEAIAQGLMREDLFYALNVVEISLPPLRLRRDDIPMLVASMLDHFARRDDRTEPYFDADVIAALKGHHWPGNLSQLQSLIRGLVLTHAGKAVKVTDLPTSLLVERAAGPDETAQARNATATGINALVGKRLADIERAVIEATIAAEGGSVPQAAKVLDVSPSTIYRKREAWLKKDGL